MLYMYYKGHLPIVRIYITLDNKYNYPFHAHPCPHSPQTGTKAYHSLICNNNNALLRKWEFVT